MTKLINKVIKALIISECILNSAWGFIGPIFAIFIVETITMGDPGRAARVAGFSTLVYWFVKSFLQIPISRYLDKNHGERDTFWFNFSGRALIAIVPFGYLVSSLPWHIYACQVVYALGSAMIIPSFYSIFTKFIDKGKEAFEWGMNSTMLGFGVGITGALGGILYSYFGYQIIFILVGSVTILSALVMLFVKKEVFEK